MRVRPRQGDNAGAVRPPIDEIAQQNQPVVPGQGEFFQQLFELPGASVDVADCNNPAFHGEPLISVGRWTALEKQAAASGAARWPSTEIRSRKPSVD